jgi:hypothetical protein
MDEALSPSGMVLGPDGDSSGVNQLHELLSIFHLAHGAGLLTAI